MLTQLVKISIFITQKNNFSNDKQGVNVTVKKIIPLLIAVVLMGCANQASQTSTSQASNTLTSPDGTLGVNVFVTDTNTLAYTITRDGKPVILNSDLGLELTSADFTQDVKIQSRSAVKDVRDSYSMRVGKKSQIEYTAKEQNFTIENDRQQALVVTVRVSNDGVAFRYSVSDPAIGEKQFVNEATSFRFEPTARAWLQPMAVAQTGWSNTNPSYEEFYEIDIPVGTASTLGAGWVFPALFKTDDNWVLISETNLKANWHGSRLHHESDDGNYRVATPDPREIFPGGALLAHAKEELVSPWRIIVIGDLATVMESTLGTDLAAPAMEMPTDFIKPGHSSWSWAILKDDYTIFDVQKKFIDYAADMHWDYTLIDADWDQKIGYEKLEELVDYAAQKDIGILVWFNSAGSWNEAPFTPRSQLLTHEQRTAVFSRLREIGVKGVKIDFFGGDGQSMMAYYIDILKDAAQHNLLVNFHGATLPRGWHRTYPNLMTMESIRGFEFGTFVQENQDRIASMAVMGLFTRNVFEPMDFTPMVFGDIPSIERATENSFELALSVLMVSGIQHFAEIPEGMATAPGYVQDFLRELPREWDDVKFITGYPGKNIALARRAGDVWYVAGINADSEETTLNLDLSFTGGAKGILISSGDNERSFNRQGVDSRALQTVNLRPNAGFVMILK